MRLRPFLFGTSLFASTALLATASQAQTAPTPGATAPAQLSLETQLVDNLPTAFPIKHVVIIYDEGNSFDHYFATYPHASNPGGESAFTAPGMTPSVNNLSSAKLLTHNPNDTNPANGAGATNPFRIDPAQAATAAQNDGYTAEQQAYDGGSADLFPEFTGAATTGGTGPGATTGQTMGFFDGNTVTALWRYATHFAMADNAFANTYGPGTLGALEVVSGQTNGYKPVASSNTSYYIPDGAGGYTLIGNVDPAGDVCSSTTDQGMMTSLNIGDLLNAANIPWGGFMGGFNLGTSNSNGTNGCGRSTASSVTSVTSNDYVPDHAWFQYYTSTANPTHARPLTLADIGYSNAVGGTPDPANHQYDITDFYSAVAAGDYPAVSYIKLPAYQDGHAGYSDPLDEQSGLVTLVNFIESQPDWSNTAIFITYGDTGGWYDHAYTTPTSTSTDPTADQLDGPGMCGAGTPHPSHGVVSRKPVNGRCGPGGRIPFLVISPYARANYVTHFLFTQASLVKFIEENWMLSADIGRGSFVVSSPGSLRKLFNFHTHALTPALMLDPTTGEPQ